MTRKTKTLALGWFISITLFGACSSKRQETSSGVDPTQSTIDSSAITTHVDSLAPKGTKPTTPAPNSGIGTSENGLSTDVVKKESVDSLNRK